MLECSNVPTMYTYPVPYPDVNANNKSNSKAKNNLGVDEGVHTSETFHILKEFRWKTVHFVWLGRKRKYCLNVLVLKQGLENVYGFNAKADLQLKINKSSNVKKTLAHSVVEKTWFPDQL